MAVTKSIIETLAGIAARRAGKKLALEWTGARPQLYEVDRGGGLWKLTPPLTKRAMRDWLGAFIEGIDFGRRAPR